MTYFHFHRAWVHVHHIGIPAHFLLIGLEGRCSSHFFFHLLNLLLQGSAWICELPFALFVKCISPSNHVRVCVPEIILSPSRSAYCSILYESEPFPSSCSCLVCKLHQILHFITNTALYTLHLPMYMEPHQVCLICD